MYEVKFTKDAIAVVRDGKVLAVFLNKKVAKRGINVDILLPASIFKPIAGTKLWVVILGNIEDWNDARDTLNAIRYLVGYAYGLPQSKWHHGLRPVGRVSREELASMVKSLQGIRVNAIDDLFKSMVRFKRDVVYMGNDKEQNT